MPRQYLRCCFSCTHDSSGQAIPPSAFPFKGDLSPNVPPYAGANASPARNARTALLLCFPPLFPPRASPSAVAPCCGRVGALGGVSEREQVVKAPEGRERHRELRAEAAHGVPALVPARPGGRPWESSAELSDAEPSYVLNRRQTPVRDLRSPQNQRSSLWLKF